MVLQDNESLGLTVDAGHLVIDDARPDAECGSVQACFRRFGEVKSARAYDASGITSVLEPDRLIRPRRPVACGIFIGPTSALPKSGLARHRIFQPAAPVADAAFISGHKPASQAAGGLALRDEAETCAYTVWVDAHLDSPTVQLSHLLWSVLAWLSPAAPLGPLIAFEPMPWSSALSHRVRVLAGSLAESALLARVEAARPRDVLLSPPPLVVTSPAPWGSDVRVTATVSDAAVYIIERPDDAVSPALAAAASAVGWVRIGASGEVTVVADLLGLRIQRAAAAETTHAHLSAAVSNLTGSVPQAIAALPFRALCSRMLITAISLTDGLRQSFSHCAGPASSACWFRPALMEAGCDTTQRTRLLFRRQCTLPWQRQRRSRLGSAMTTSKSSSVPSLLDFCRRQLLRLKQIISRRLVLVNLRVMSRLRQHHRSLLCQRSLQTTYVSTLRALRSK